MKTPHEIALEFSEKFQKIYPNKPLWEMMEELRIEIEKYGNERVKVAIGGNKS